MVILQDPTNWQHLLRGGGHYQNPTLLSTHGGHPSGLAAFLSCLWSEHAIKFYGYARHWHAAAPSSHNEVFYSY